MTPPRRRRGRTRAAAVVAAGVLLGLVAGVVPAQAAPWQGSAARSATVSTARVSSGLVLVAGAGTVSADRSTYSMSTTVATQAGYLDLVNTGTVPATLSLDVAIGAVVGGAPATVCSVAWNTTADTCAGTTTTVSLTALVGRTAGSHTSPALVAAGDGVHLRVKLGGVISGVTVTATTVVPRPAGDRTQG
ncbi:hypothetical protein [Klenkia taihuensis]|uniref:SipW-cognate class signal peptide n=1 Tax=Klenkia taihuensis TaxID=1225127 RepID=A0A1I1JTM9_9ACTN|nr:hypothetical protein [Klenkia taihuensis]GHE10701.1 hypothetical protein GCM10011381_20990 [Klenkia taihuensis]SFC51866.1 hypothetical protein SAMN05661030_1182 [Klenkia taihuensis]